MGRPVGCWLRGILDTHILNFGPTLRDGWLYIQRGASGHCEWWVYDHAPGNNPCSPRFARLGVAAHGYAPSLAGAQQAALDAARQRGLPLPNTLDLSPQGDPHAQSTPL